MSISLSKSSVELWDLCRAKYKKRYIDKDKGFQTLEEKKRTIFGNVIHDTLDFYYNNGKKNIIKVYKKEFEKSEISDKELFELGEARIVDYVKSVDNGNKVLCIEQEFQIYLDNGVPIKGIVDRVDEISEEEIEIIDYKSGMSAPLNESGLDDDIQVGMYTLWAKHNFPNYKRIKVSLYYLHFGKVSTYIPESKLDSLKNYLEVIYNKITTCKDFPETLNNYCSFCEYRSKCNEYKRVVEKNNEEALIVLPSSGMTLNPEKVNELFESLKNKEKIIKKLRSDLSSVIKEYIQNTGDSRVKLGDKEFSLASKKYMNYSANTVVALCAEKQISPSKVLDVRKAEVDKIFKDEESIKRLKETTTVSYSDTYVK